LNYDQLHIHRSETCYQVIYGLRSNLLND